MAEDIPETFTLQTPQQWKALSHPIRLRMLDLLAEEARTNEEMADALGEQSGKLYFHTRRLREAGLIVLDRTRQKGPITEKLYRAVARRFVAAPLVKGGDVPPLEEALVSALDLYRSNWHETGGLAGEIELGFHLVLPQTPDRLQEFAHRVRALFNDFQECELDAPGAKTVSLAVLMHSFTTADTTKGRTDAVCADDGARDGPAGGDGGGDAGG